MKGMHKHVMSSQGINGKVRDVEEDKTGDTRDNGESTHRVPQASEIAGCTTNAG